MTRQISSYSGEEDSRIVPELAYYLRPYGTEVRLRSSLWDIKSSPTPFLPPKPISSSLSPNNSFVCSTHSLLNSTNTFACEHRSFLLPLSQPISRTSSSPLSLSSQSREIVKDVCFTHSPRRRHGWLRLCSPGRLFQHHLRSPDDRPVHVVHRSGVLLVDHSAVLQLYHSIPEHHG